MVWIRILLFLALVIIEKSYGNDFPGHVKYLMKYGYFDVPEEGDIPDSLSAEDIENALKKAQQFFRIPVTGKLDNQTAKILSAYRCGVPDVGRKASPYVLDGKWDKRDLTYGFINYSPKIKPFEITHAIQQALSKWSKPSGLKFTHSDKNADINIGFFKGEHGDGFPFQIGKELAHAFYPGADNGGDVHFNDYNTFVVDKNKAVLPAHLLLSVAIHELGHALGLKHSSVAGAIMQPVYSGATELGDDDIQGIKKLYGS